MASSATWWKRFSTRAPFRDRLAPNLASRSGLATPQRLVPRPRRLAGGMFTYADMGSHQLQGLEKPVHVWRVTGESLSGVRFDAHRTELFECVGRDAELDTLVAGWNLARRGRCSIVTVTGEAGIGKSRLLRTASDQFARSAGLLALLQCSPNQAATPLHPLIAWIRREARVGRTDGPEDLAQLAAWLGEAATRMDLALLADLVGVPVPEAQALPAMPPDRKRNLTREVLLRHSTACRYAPPLHARGSHWIDSAPRISALAVPSHAPRPFMSLINSRPRSSATLATRQRARDRLGAATPTDASVWCTTSARKSLPPAASSYPCPTTASAVHRELTAPFSKSSAGHGRPAAAAGHPVTLATADGQARPA